MVFLPVRDYLRGMTAEGTGQLLIEEVVRETRSITGLLPTVDLSPFFLLVSPVPSYFAATNSVCGTGSFKARATPSP
jgi:hypothetical protein